MREQQFRFQTGGHAFLFVFDVQLLKFDFSAKLSNDDNVFSYLITLYLTDLQLHLTAVLQIVVTRTLKKKSVARLKMSTFRCYVTTTIENLEIKWTKKTKFVVDTHAAFGGKVIFRKLDFFSFPNCNCSCFLAILSAN